MLLTGYNFKSNNSNGSVQALKIEDKIQGLKEILAMQSMDLQHKSVVIAVPSFDENMRSIYLDNKGSFGAQQKDAHVLAQYMMENMGADLVSIITGLDKVNCLVNRVTKSFECMVLLHEFMGFEKNMLLEILTEHNADLNYFELY